MTSGSVFLAVWVVVVAMGLTRLVAKRRRESPTREFVRGQPVIFATRAAVLIRLRRTGGSGWGTLSGAGWPQLLVHSGGLEVTIGAFDGLVSGNTMLIAGAKMRRERLGAFPFVVGNHDCIRLWGTDGVDPHEWKVSPRGTPIDEVWGQLVAAGVTPTA
jgi:hypothetical protein